MKKKFLINGQEHEVEIKSHNHEGLTFVLGEKEWSFSHADAQALYKKNENGVQKRYPVFKNKKGTTTIVACGTKTFCVEEVSVRSKKAQHQAGSMISPMPGKILKVFKQAGMQVEVGETILVMEAMKMEHAIKASSAGTIAKILRQEGEQVEGGVLLVELEEAKS